jgi:methyltransferase (TIGR00027 family)
LGHGLFQLQHEQASRTALFIAASLVLLHSDPKHSALVSKNAADLCSQVLENQSWQTRIFSRIIRQSWFRPFAKLIERVTIPGILLHYGFRKKCVATLLRSALTNGTTQAVVVGAGFDPLCLELQREFPATDFWEIDHPVTQRAKLRALSKTSIERLHFVAIDLSADALDRETLIKSGFDPAKRTFWIAEGLLMYFPGDIVSSLMRMFSSLTAPNSQFAFTFMEKQDDGRIRFESQSKLVDRWLRKREEPFLWGSTRNDLADCIRPWRVVRFFDHDDFVKMQLGSSDEFIAKGEVICLAEI